MINQYRKKPVVIEAVQFIGNNIKFLVEEFIDKNYLPCGDDSILFIETLEGQMKALPGDYIIKGIKGEFYPCKPDIFEATYDQVI